MKHARQFVMTLALVAMSAALLPALSHGQPRETAARAAAPSGLATAPPTEDHWVGGVAAIGCGFGIRVSIAMPNPLTVAGTAVMCLIMLADGIRS
jgi:hypothetical protein